MTNVDAFEHCWFANRVPCVVARIINPFSPSNVTIQETLVNFSVATLPWRINQYWRAITNIFILTNTNPRIKDHSRYVKSCFMSFFVDGNGFGLKEPASGLKFGMTILDGIVKIKLGVFIVKAQSINYALLLFEGICGHCNGNFTLRGHLPSNQKSKSTV